MRCVVPVQVTEEECSCLYILAVGETPGALPTYHPRLTGVSYHLRPARPSALHATHYQLGAQ